MADQSWLLDGDRVIGKERVPYDLESVEKAFPGLVGAIKEAIIQDIRQGGRIARELEQRYRLSRKGGVE